MESRVVIFLVLSLAIIFAYPYLLVKMGVTPPETSVKTGTATSTGKTSPATSLPHPPNESASSEETVSPTTQDALPSPEISTERLKVIESDLYRVVLSSRGGVVKEWQLKKYTKQDEKGKEHPIPLLHAGATVSPLDITVTGESLGDYTLDETTLELNDRHPTGTVTMQADLPEGRSLTKKLTFYNNHYHVDLAVSAKGFPEYRLALGSNFGITDWKRNMGGAAGAMSMIDGKVISEHPEQETITRETGVQWFGFNDTYFMSALIPLSASKETKAEKTGKVTVQGMGKDNLAAYITIPVRQDVSDKFILYAGPKEYSRLVTYPHFLDEAIDFGWFIYGSWLPVRLVAKPLFYILRFLHNLTQNYGWAIILLTVLIKVVFHPITQKSMTSMKQMSALQPKVAAIREKWANNKEKMNKELMNLYREAGANPLGGCLPMLLQMPVFVALFNILYVTIDLKHAPFIFWITDLSSKDPYYVLPVVMGGTMILQQWMQPSTMDPAQSKIMMFMPVVYTFFFLRFPSGLVLYWLVNNLLSIAQQYWINHRA